MQMMVPAQFWPVQFHCPMEFRPANSPEMRAPSTATELSVLVEMAAMTPVSPPEMMMVV
jgi:hypothetical protein